MTLDIERCQCALNAVTPWSWAVNTRPALKMPVLLDATQTGRIDLTIQAGQVDFLGRGIKSPTKGFNGAFLGPVLRLPRRDTQVSITNQTQQPTTVHWHGMLIPGAVDGGPHEMIATGSSWRPVLPDHQPAATVWYHAHPHGRTARDVYSGLAGVIHIVDGRDDERGLPHSYGEDDFTLVLQDRYFDQSGAMVYDTSMPTRMHGLHGNAILVNGQYGTQLSVPKGWVRLRLLNGSNARIYPLSFADGREMHLVATDGGYLKAPVSLQQLWLSPGERYEILVDFSNGQAAVMRSEDDPNAMGGGSGFAVLPFVVDTSKKARMKKMPSDLGSTEAKWAVPGKTNRVLTLDMGMGPGMMMRGMSGGAGGFAISGESFDMHRINQQIKLGTVERWRVESSMMMHPFHVHGVQFKVLSMAGGTPPPQYQGWHDTVLVNGSVEFAMRFDEQASKEKPYMYHCHILEHEDAGMMGQFSVSA